jgi:hypothetical protein
MIPRLQIRGLASVLFCLTCGMLPATVSAQDSVAKDEIPIERRGRLPDKERGRLPSLTSQDAWEKRMAEGAAFVRYKDEGRYE